MNFTLINPNYLGDFQPIYLPYMILNFFGIVLGTLGNLTILLTIAFDKNLNKNPAYMFMFNLALADISISIFVDGFTNIGNSRIPSYRKFIFIDLMAFFFVFIIINKLKVLSIMHSFFGIEWDCVCF